MQNKLIFFYFFTRKKSKWEESVRDSGEESRNWRWSESPEIELDQGLKSLEKRCSQSMEKNDQESWESSRKRNRKQSEESSRRSSRKRSRTDRESDEEAILISRFSKRRKKKSERRDYKENGHENVRKKN